MVGADSTFSKGDRLDRYEIRELIGEGGMGAIYRAVDTKLGRNVALKVVRPARLGSSTGDQARQRFLRETLAISKVDHRNVVRVLDFGFSGDTPYLAMEYLRGRDLGKVLKGTTEPLPVTEVVDVMLGVCAAIRACHEAGIIHRDLKPSNVFLCEDDSERVVKILDFGVSKPTVASDLTHDGQIVGTPQYLAPEQIDGKAVPQTDQYAIGVMLYLCLTGALPYRDHAGLGLLRAIFVGKFDPPRALRADLPETLEGIILRAMRAAPDERFESVHALGRALWEFASPPAREQWRAYYLDDLLRAPPKASTHAMPLIEAMALGLAAAPTRTPAALAPTETVAPVAADGPAPDVARRPTPAGADRATHAAGAQGPREPSRSTATLEPPAVGAGAGGRRRMVAAAVVVVAVAVGLGGVGWRMLRRPRVAAASKPVAPAPTVTAAGPPARPLPEATEPPPPVAPTPVPSERAVPPASPGRAEKHHRRNNRQPPPEDRADVVQHPSTGVPIMP
jgi:tRNA A-37 threonylcarbamoyl transferase component Bud32